MSFSLKLYQSEQTVFTMQEIALLFGETKRVNLKSKINYYVKKEVLKNLRKGVYAKPNYDPMEAAVKIYTPSYISLETVLQKSGVIFQHYETIFAISYLTRQIEFNGHKVQYRRIKQEILLNPSGILQKNNFAMATPERAFLDALYLYKNYYFDNLQALNKKNISDLLKIYQSKNLREKVEKILKNA